MNKIILSLLLCLTAQSSMAVIIPIKADTYVDNSVLKYGPFGYMYVNPKSKALIQFDFSIFPVGKTAADIDRATLVLFNNKVTTAGTIKLSPITSTWDESTAGRTTVITTDETKAVSSQNITKTGSYTAIDLTNMVIDWLNNPTSNKGLLIQPLSLTTSITLDAKESTSTSHPAYIDVIFKGSGAQGLKGDKGDKGDTGLTGAPGLDGLPGAKGDIGPTGATGPAGPIGLKGDKGDTGPAGSLASMAFKPGDTGPGGGIIFYVDYFDQYPSFTYLESAPTELASNYWCNDTSANINISGTDASTAVGHGAINTTNMLNVCTSGAANDADSYVAPNSTDDWYLPSSQELTLLLSFARQHGLVVPDFLLKNNVLVANVYWSSTGLELSKACVVSVNNASTGNQPRDAMLKIWPIRSF